MALIDLSRCRYDREVRRLRRMSDRLTAMLVRMRNDGAYPKTRLALAKAIAAIDVAVQRIREQEKPEKPSAGA